MNESQQLRDKLIELDKKLKAAREKIRRDRIQYRLLREERQETAAFLKRTGYNTGEKRSGLDDTHFVKSLKVAEQIAYWVEYEEGNYRILSDMSHVSVRTISEIVSQRRIWATMDTADRILIALGCQWLLNELETKVNERYRPPNPPESAYYEE